MTRVGTVCDTCGDCMCKECTQIFKILNIGILMNYLTFLQHRVYWGKSFQEKSGKFEDTIETVISTIIYIFYKSVYCFFYFNIRSACWYLERERERERERESEREREREREMSVVYLYCSIIAKFYQKCVFIPLFQTFYTFEFLQFGYFSKIFKRMQPPPQKKNK